MNAYGVETAHGAPITTVYAHSVDGARRRAREVLDRPGRRQLLRQWQAAGEPIRDKSTNQVTTR